MARVLQAMWQRKFFWIVAGITSLAFTLRVFRLDAQSLWWDEIIGVVIARMPSPQWLEPVFQDRGFPPEFYFMLRIWTQLGSGEFFWRFLPVMFGTLSTAVLARLGVRLGGRRAGITAAILMALSPFYIWYSQELRMYAPLVFAAATSGWLCFELLHHPRARLAVALLLVDVFGLYIHYLFGIYLLTQLVFIITARGRYARAVRWWLAATFGAGLAFVPWFVALQLSPIGGRPNLDWIPNTQWFDPALSLYVILGGATQDPAQLWTWIPALLGLALAVYGARVAWRSGSREGVRYLLYWLLLPTLFLFFVSMPVPGRSLYVDRYLAPFALPLLVLIAFGAAELWRRKRLLIAGMTAVALVPLCLSLFNMYFEPRYARDDWRGLSEYLAQHADPARDAVLLDLSLELPYGFYDGTALPVIEHPFPEEQDPANWLSAQDLKFPNVWLITTAIPVSAHRLYPDTRGQLAFSKQDAYKHSMDSRFGVEREQWFAGLVLTEYKVLP